MWVAYLEAHNAGRAEDMLSAYGDGAVFEIPGVAVLEGRDALQGLVAWDVTLHSTLETAGYEQVEDTLLIERITETNDWFRAMGIETVRYAPGTRVRVAEGRIVEVRPAMLVPESAAALESAMGAFVEWAVARPEAPLAQLMPAGRWVYSGESARRWMAWIGTWKAEPGEPAASPEANAPHSAGQ